MENTEKMEAFAWIEKHYYVECPYCHEPVDMGVDTFWTPGEEWTCDGRDGCGEVFLLPRVPRDL